MKNELKFIRQGEIFMPKGIVHIDTAQCKGCELCVQVCPKSVLAMSKKMNSKGFYPVEAVNSADCTGCTLCATICPDIVIRVERALISK